MNALEIFKVLGIKPTDDYKEVRSVYINKLRKYQTKLAKMRGTDEETTLSEDILKLNEAFNLLSEENILATTVRAEAIRNEQDLLPKSLRGTIEYESVTKTETPGENIKALLDAVEIKWEDKDLSNITENITLHDFLNGSAIMFEDNSTLNIPAGFLGLMSRVVDNKIQFIKIKNKDSVIFTFDSKGNLVLKCIPEDAEFKNNILSFNVKEHKFEFDLDACKFSEKELVWVGQHQGVKAYKAKKAGDLLIKQSLLKGAKNPGITEQVKAYFTSLGDTVS